MVDADALISRRTLTDRRTWWMEVILLNRNNNACRSADERREGVYG
jgi:hypothetical protein